MGMDTGTESQTGRPDKGQALAQVAQLAELFPHLAHEQLEEALNANGGLARVDPDRVLRLDGRREQDHTT